MNTKTHISSFLQTQRDKPVALVQGLVRSLMSLVVANAINGDYAVIGVERDIE
jgi:hypothetical protein